MKLICKNCDREFESDRSNKKYCSKKCYTNIQKLTIPKWFNHIWRKTKPKNQNSAICLVCHDNFEYWAGRKNVKYCSKNCWNKRNPKTIHNCLYCKQEFKEYNSANKIYCKNKCRA